MMHIFNLFIFVSLCSIVSGQGAAISTSTDLVNYFVIGVRWPENVAYVDPSNQDSLLYVVDTYTNCLDTVNTTTGETQIVTCAICSGFGFAIDYTHGYMYIGNVFDIGRIQLSNNQIQRGWSAQFPF